MPTCWVFGGVGTLFERAGVGVGAGDADGHLPGCLRRSALARLMGQRCDLDGRESGAYAVKRQCLASADLYEKSMKSHAYQVQRADDPQLILLASLTADQRRAPIQEGVDAMPSSFSRTRPSVAGMVLLAGVAPGSRRPSWAKRRIPSQSVDHPIAVCRQREQQHRVRC